MGLIQMFRRASLTFRMGVPPGAGHIVRMPPKKILYGELINGKRNRGGGATKALQR